MELNQIVIYQTKGGQTAVDVNLSQETVWLTQFQIANLFKRDQSVISRHINNIFKEEELDKKSNMHFLHNANSISKYQYKIVQSGLSTMNYRLSSINDKTI